MSARRAAEPSKPAAAGWEEQLEGGRRERWVIFAYCVAGMAGLLFLYLGLRPGGMGPIRAYLFGRPLLFLIAGATLLLGILFSIRRRPVLQAGRLAAFGCLGGTVWLCSMPLGYPSSHQDHPSAVRFRLPFEAVEGDALAWTVRWGGGKMPASALFEQPDRCYGFDFVITDAEGRSVSEDAYLCEGARVLAPSSGEVVTVHDGEPDVGFREFPRSEEPYGNHVVIRVADEEYLFLIGLQDGSIAVRVGDQVEPGDLLGKVGHTVRSPLSPEAGLGVHLQDSPEPRRGEGIPFWFRGYQSGEREVERGVPQGGFRGGRHVGERVRPLDGDDS